MGRGMLGRLRVPAWARTRSGRVATIAAGLVVLLGATALVAYRVFVPHDTLTRPTVPYPKAVMISDERPFSELRAAPLVVEGRLRVYAEKWRVWADAPVGERYESTPYWAYRRWPAQAVGVAVVTTAQGPFVITQWSDGEIVALNARLGEVAWRANSPVGTASYTGRRTGAAVVYEPRSLLTGRAGTRTIVLATAPGTVGAFDGATGAALWRRDVPDGCEPLAWTGASLLVLPTCDGSSITFVSLVDGATKATWAPDAGMGGNPTPMLCTLGRSECRLVSVGARAWLLNASGRLTAVPPLEPGSVLAGDRVVYTTETGVAARRLTDGTPLWTWTGTARLIAADTVGVYLLRTSDRTVLSLSPVTGTLSVLGCASSRPNEDWRIGHIHPTDGSYLVLERITNAPATSKDSLYYYGPRPVALVELYPPTKLPVWSGKFAACVPLG